MKTKKLTSMALLTGIALVVFVIENQIPAPVPIPGVKLGLANTVTLMAIWLLGPKEGAVVQLLRVVLGSFICGTVSAMLYSLAGAALCLGVMCALKPLLGRKQIWFMSIVGALAHNIGQMAAAVAITQTPSLLAYLPVLGISAVITGLFTGLCAQFTLERLTGGKRHVS